MTVSRLESVTTGDLTILSLGRAAPPSESESSAPKSETAQALQEIEEFLGGFDKRLEFTIDDEAERVVVRVLDRSTGDIIRQVPPEHLLPIIASVNRLLGMLFDRTV